MSTAGKSLIKKVGEREVVCREMTVAVVRKLVGQPFRQDLVTDSLLDSVRLHDLELMTNLTLADMEDMHPSELEQVIAGCKEANPTFFGLLARIAKAQSKA